MHLQSQDQQPQTHRWKNIHGKNCQSYNDQNLPDHNRNTGPLRQSATNGIQQAITIYMA